MNPVDILQAIVLIVTIPLAFLSVPVYIWMCNSTAPRLRINFDFQGGELERPFLYGPRGQYKFELTPQSRAKYALNEILVTFSNPEFQFQPTDYFSPITDSPTSAVQWQGKQDFAKNQPLNFQIPFQASPDIDITELTIGMAITTSLYMITLFSKPIFAKPETTFTKFTILYKRQTTAPST